MLEYAEEGGAEVIVFSAWTGSGVTPGRFCSGSGSSRTTGLQLWLQMRICSRSCCCELGWLEEQRARVSSAERLPGAIRSFLSDFESFDVRHQKAQLQDILQSAYVSRNDRIELELRGEGLRL